MAKAVKKAVRKKRKERKNIVFDMVCKGISCQIRDVVHNGSSFKRAHEYIVKNKACLI